MRVCLRCFSGLYNILGQPVSMVNRLSTKSAYKKLLEVISKKLPYQLYFMMMSVDGKMAFLYISDDEDNWVAEKLALEKGRSYAVVVDFEKMTASVEQISYKMINGGPLFISE